MADDVRFDMPESIETGRLHLRRYQPDDADWYVEMSRRNQPHLARYEAGNAAMFIHSVQDAAGVMRDFGEAWDTGIAFFIGAFERGTGQFVAQMYVGVADRKLPAFQVGYFADAGHEGRGYVTEALNGVLHTLFETLGAHRVALLCDDINERSWRVAERCGFTREGHLREDKRNPDGSISGTLCYGLLSREFGAGASSA